MYAYGDILRPGTTIDIMKSRDIIIGFMFLVIFIAGVLFIYKNKNIKNSKLAIQTPNIVSRITTTFPNFKIPEGVERANLVDVKGGNNIGVATRSEVVANLPDGQIYNVFLENSSGNKINLGIMRISKSGWLLNYSSSKYPGYNKIVITDGKTSLLEGSF